MTRVGVVFADLGKLKPEPLEYLIVRLNTVQSAVEFELLDFDLEDPLLRMLRYRQRVDRGSCREMLPAFHERLFSHIVQQQEHRNLADRQLPDGVVVISLARLSEDFYTMKNGPVAVQALGNWDRYMSPPSLLEFIVALLFRQSAAFVTPAVSRSIHLGTRGCLFDFNERIQGARYKALQAYVCSTCTARLNDAGAGFLVSELKKIVEMRWLGRVDDPYSPSGVIAKFGHNLFLTQGRKASFWEASREALRSELAKEVLKLVSAIVVAWLLLRFGLKGSG